MKYRKPNHLDLRHADRKTIPYEGIPYNVGKFLLWCVEKDGKTPDTSQTYCSILANGIANKYENEEYNSFVIAWEAFEDSADIDYQDYIDGIIEAIKFFYMTLDIIETDVFIADTDVVLDPTSENKATLKRMRNYRAALSTYTRFLEYLATEVIEKYGMPEGYDPDSIKKPKTVVSCPMLPKFRHWLLANKYQKRTAYTYCAKLKNINEKVLKRIRPSIDCLGKNPETVEEIMALSEQVNEAIQSEIECPQFPEIPRSDLRTAASAMVRYADFLKDQLTNK